MKFDWRDCVLVSSATALSLLSGLGWWTFVTVPLFYVLGCVSYIAVWSTWNRNRCNSAWKTFKLNFCANFAPSKVELCPKCNCLRWRGSKGC